MPYRVRATYLEDADQSSRAFETRDLEQFEGRAAAIRNAHAWCDRLETELEDATDALIEVVEPESRAVVWRKTVRLRA